MSSRYEQYKQYARRVSCPCHRPAKGHRFDENLLCFCGKHYSQHHANPRKCGSPPVVFKNTKKEKGNANKQRDKKSKDD